HDSIARIGEMPADRVAVGEISPDRSLIDNRDGYRLWRVVFRERAASADWDFHRPEEVRADMTNVDGRIAPDTQVRLTVDEEKESIVRPCHRQIARRSDCRHTRLRLHLVQQVGEEPFARHISTVLALLKRDLRRRDIACAETWIHGLQPYQTSEQQRRRDEQ